MGGFRVEDVEIVEGLRLVQKETRLVVCNDKPGSVWKLKNAGTRLHPIACRWQEMVVMVQTSSAEQFHGGKSSGDFWRPPSVFSFL